MRLALSLMTAMLAIGYCVEPAKGQYSNLQGTTQNAFKIGQRAGGTPCTLTNSSGTLSLAGLTVGSGTINFNGATVSNGGSMTTVDINGGTIDGADIGGDTPGEGSFTVLTASGIMVSTLATGTAPFTIASATKCANLNVDAVDGMSIGTGVVGGIAYGSSTSALSFGAAGTTGQHLISAGTGTPSWAGLTSAYIWVGNGSNIPTAVAMSGDVTISNSGATTLNSAHAKSSTQFSVEDLAADADIAARPVFVRPGALTLVSIGILTQGASAGVDDSNTVVIAFADDASNSIVSKTYNTGTQPPSSDYADLGALNGTNKILTATEHVLMSVTQGGTANMPAFVVVIVFESTNA